MLLALASLWSIPAMVDLSGDASAASAAGASALFAPASLSGGAASTAEASGSFAAPAGLSGDAASASTAEGAVVARQSLAGDALAGTSASAPDLVDMQFLIRCGGVWLTPGGRIIASVGGLALCDGVIQSVDLGPVSITPAGVVLVNA